MNFNIHYNTKVITDDIPKLPKPIANQIKNAIESKLARNPGRFGKPLRKSLYGFKSLRVGDYRTIFWIRGKIVRIELIQHRAKVYKNILKRMGII